MLIKNKKDGDKYLVLGFYFVDGKKAYITFNDVDKIVLIQLDSEVEVIDNSYSKFWIETEDKYSLPSGWDETNFLYELVDDLSPLDNIVFRNAKEKIENEFNYYFENIDSIQESAIILDGMWVECPNCHEVFEIRMTPKIIICPNSTCQSKLTNPFFTS